MASQPKGILSLLNLINLDKPAEPGMILSRCKFHVSANGVDGKKEVEKQGKSAELGKPTVFHQV
jgi:hypothetical protein